MSWLPLGAERRIGSTPPRSVITVSGSFPFPCVVTTMTASPFCKSESVAAGMRAIICWKSPPPRPLCGTPGAALCCEFSATWPCGDGADAPGPPADWFLSRAASPSANCAGSLRICDSPLIFKVTSDLDVSSCTTSELDEASLLITVPAMLRNVPETISVAASSAPPSPRVPRARNWSPGWISVGGATLAASNRVEWSHSGGKSCPW